jgi:two-component system response regulator WspF
MRIGILCDQPAMAECLRNAVTQAQEHEVTWTAASGREAIEHCGADAPDLMLMVLRVTGIDIRDATRRIMSSSPCPILLVTVDKGAHVGPVFEAMGHGALDVVDLPTLISSAPQDSTALLLRKIATIARLIGDRNGVRRRPAQSTLATVSSRCDRLVVIGASAGGPAALAEILASVPRDLPAAIVIVQHVDAQFTVGMTEWLSDQSGLCVRVAKDGDRLVHGGVFMAGTSDHLVVEGTEHLTYTREPVHHAYRPSIDVLFESVSRHWRGKAVGVLLTGMGKDGARGLKVLRDRGHHTVAQDEATSSVYGMPKAAAALDAAVDVLPIGRIAPRLVDLITSMAARGVKQTAGHTA